MSLRSKPIDWESKPLTKSDRNDASAGPTLISFPSFGGQSGRSYLDQGREPLVFRLVESLFPTRFSRLPLLLLLLDRGRGLCRVRAQQSRSASKRPDFDRAEDRIRQATNTEEAATLQATRDIDAALDLAKASDKRSCPRTPTRGASRAGKISGQFLWENRSDCRFPKRRLVFAGSSPTLPDSIIYKNSDRRARCFPLIVN